MFPSSRKREIRQGHVAVVQSDKVQKKNSMLVQNCFLNLLLFCNIRCYRCRRCFSELPNRDFKIQGRDGNENVA